MYRIVMVTMLLMLGAILPARAQEEAGQAQEQAPAAGKKYVFAFVPKMLDNPVFNFAKIAAEKEAAAQGDVEILWKAPREGDATLQAQIVESLIRRKVDGIAISCNEPKVLERPINLAVEAGIPVITWDSDSPDSQRATFYGINDRECGQTLARHLMKAIGGKGRIAILTGVRGATNLEARINGAQEVLKEYPEVEVAQIYACNDDVPESVRQIQGALRRHPDLAGWLMVGGWPLFTKGALDSLPATCKVVCVDALPEQWPYLEQKQVEVLVAQKIYGWGAESVKILKGIHAGEKPERFTWSGMDLVTPDTLEQYKQQWQEWFGK